MQRLLRVVLRVLVAFLALTAIPGGLALLFGIGAPPTSVLEGSLFTTFVIPALALDIMVGGSAVTASLLLARRSRFALSGASLAGIIVMSFEFFQVVAIGSPAGPPRVMQVLYFLLGMALVATSQVVGHMESGAGSRAG